MGFALQLKQDHVLEKPQKVFFVLFGILFLLAPFYYQSNLGGEGLFIPHNSTIWIVATWVISAACFIIYRTGEITLPRYWFGLALMPIGAWVTSFIADNNNPTEWLVRLSVITGGYLFFLSLFQFRLNNKQIDSALIIVLLMGFITGFYGLVQTLNLTSHFPFIPFSPQLRPVGVFQQVNIQASVMATMLVLVFYVASRQGSANNRPLILIALALISVLASYNVLISGSRVGLLAILIALPCIILGRWHSLTSHKFVFIALLIAVFAGGYLGKSGLTATTEKMERVVDGMDSDIRWKIYSQSWELFKQSPIVGHGLGSFQKVFQEQRATVQAQEEAPSFGSSPRFSHPHNELIFWLVEGGALSILGIVSAAIFTLIQIFKSGWRPGITLAAIIFPIALHTQVELPFYISNTPWILFLVILFICHNTATKTVSTAGMSKAAQAMVPLSFFFISLISSFALINTQVANGGIVRYLQLKQSYPQNLLPALNNTYFREYGTYLVLRRQMFLGMREGNTTPANDFISWAKDSLEITPAVQTYRDLVAAYHFLGEQDNAEQTLKHALAIYPLHPELLNLQEKIKVKPAQLKNGQSNRSEGVTSGPSASPAQAPATQLQFQQSQHN